MLTAILFEHLSTELKLPCNNAAAALASTEHWVTQLCDKQCYTLSACHKNCQQQVCTCPPARRLMQTTSNTLLANRTLTKPQLIGGLALRIVQLFLMQLLFKITAVQCCKFTSTVTATLSQQTAIHGVYKPALERSEWSYLALRLDTAGAAGLSTC